MAAVNNTPSDSLPSPPFVDIAGIANFRDIGGYPAASASAPAPASIRPGLVYRCADPSRVQPAGLAKLKALGVGKVFDLRSLPEIQRRGPEWSGVEVDPDAFVTRQAGDGGVGGSAEVVPEGQIERVWCPVFADKDYGPEQVGLRYAQYARVGSDTELGFVQAYSDILDSGAAAYKTILTHLATPNPAPCIVHCTAGKDRTGVLIALLFLLCGTPAPTVADEYSLTDAGLAELKPLFTERLLKNPALAGNEEGVRNMVSSRRENMVATVEMLDRRFGGAERYVLDVVGLSPEQLARLRENLVAEDVAPLFPAL